MILCGHSLGGMVAQHIAAQYPSRVAKLVLADTSYGVRSTWWEALLTDLTLPVFNLAPIAWQAGVFAHQVGKHSEAAKRYVRDEIGRHIQNRENYREVWRAVAEFEGYRSMEKIESPTLLLVGALNRQTHAQARIMEKRIKTSRLVRIKSAGHMLNWDNAEEFNKVLLEFSR